MTAILRSALQAPLGRIPECRHHRHTRSRRGKGRGPAGHAPRRVIEGGPALAAEPRVAWHVDTALPAVRHGYLPLTLDGWKLSLAAS